ncbi:hypothetical protein [Halosegnis marinus]|uniref:Terminase-like family protein n=1 Tax=Halosegnis marinus TaxID=3034023 RepID=A0ABD5ZSN3_9EURY|nr:hypothetical protein [Halosegnis sp. DT85]
MPHQTPPDGYDWGERTLQGYEVLRDHRAPKYYESDAQEIRGKFSIPSFDLEAFCEHKFGRMVYPDTFIHEQSAERARSNKATDCFITAERDAGKTTFARNLSPRLMEENDEKVIWRGRSESSGWLPYRHWTQLYLPASVELDGTIMEEESDDRLQPLANERLDELVREVVYYDDVYDLLDQISERPAGTFNVVYPDPSFAGCSTVIERTDRVTGTFEFTPAWESDDPVHDPGTRTIDWWFAFIVARAEYGPFNEWWSLLFDECGDFIKQSASNAEGRLHDKIELLRSLWAASRKRKLSLFFFGHRGRNVHEIVRREFKWHIPADGSPNPTQGRRSSYPLGMQKVPMETDILSGQPQGTGICFVENEFSLFGWGNIAEPSDNEWASRWVKIRFEPPADVQAASDETVSRELAFDDTIFGEWQNAHAHRLLVKDPGSGSISVDSGEIIDELVSPIDGLRFCAPLRESTDGRYVELVMEPTPTTTPSEETVVARLPKPAQGEISGITEAIADD